MSSLNSERKTERITARVTASVHETIEYAASLQGATVNQFMLSCAIKGAEETIARERLLMLSLDESKVYLDMLASPAKPNSRAKSAYKNFQKGSFSV